MKYGVLSNLARIYEFLVRKCFNFLLSVFIMCIYYSTPGVAERLQNKLFKRQKQPLEVLCVERFLRNLTKFTAKHLRQSLFFNKPSTLLKKSLWHRCFPVNFVKFLRTPFLQNTSGRLLPKR